MAAPIPTNHDEIRPDGITVVRIFEADPERQVAALMLLLTRAGRPLAPAEKAKVVRDAS